MALPIVAVVGRPNVGKSTLVNRIAESNDAIVHEMRGVTRDRSYHQADWNGLDFTLIDTGGIEVGGDDDFQRSITAQALQATKEADLILLVVDGKAGLASDDDDVARILQRTDTPTLLVVNKMDNPEREEGLWEFYQLGLGEPWPVSATHGHGTGDLLDETVRILKALPQREEKPEEATVIHVAIIGRPNAGKSSLTNKLTDDERSIVSPLSGTTRDAVDTMVTHDGRLYRIIDTAGLRRKSQIDQDVEYFGYVRAMKAIDRADVALLVMDGTVGLTNEDQRIANYAEERGCALALVLNKWDIVEGPEAKAKVRDDIAENMQFASYAPIIAISALTGKNVQRVWDVIDECFAHFSSMLPTAKLNRWLADIHESGHTVTKGKTVLRIKYVTQTGVEPPQFTFFCNRPDVVTDNYRRFLENRLRKTFDLSGTPVRLRFKKKD